MAVVTFETLREVQRREKKSESLSQLNDEFYTGVNEYFERAEKSDTAEALNARNVFNDIIDRREKKILNLVIGSVRFAEKPNTGALTTKEKELFEKLASAMSEFRKVFGNAKSRSAHRSGREKENAESTEPTIELEKMPEENKNYMQITILEDIPEIVGADLKDYGPFRSGELVNLPRENADLFIKNGKAKLAK